MGHFRPWSSKVSQNDEVSPECTHHVTREVVVRYPHGPRNKLLLGSAPHLTQRTASGGILNASVFRRFTRPWVKNGYLRDTIGMRHVGGPETGPNSVKQVLNSVKHG